MPNKNTVKIYVKDGIYHIYNRGVEKRTIFNDDDDRRIFVNCLKEALLDPKKLKPSIHSFTLKGQTFKGERKPPKNFFEKIELLAYCLMPNHIHLLIKQNTSHAINQFMQSVITRYVIHFNKSHKRIGALFQGRYKATLVTKDPYLLHLTRYIHRNPMKYTDDIINTFSSYGEYLGVRNTEWIKPEMILTSFQPSKLPFLKHTNTYKSFVEFDNDNKLDEFLDDSLTLENEADDESEELV